MRTALLLIDRVSLEAEEKYLGKYHDMYFGASNVTAQFQLNGSLTPGFPANPPELLELSRNAVEMNGGEIPVKTLDQYKSNYSVTSRTLGSFHAWSPKFDICNCFCCRRPPKSDAAAQPAADHLSHLNLNYMR